MQEIAEQVRPDPFLQPLKESPWDVLWDESGRDSNDSMPLGNGDIGANVWTEAKGDILFYLSKTDAWSEVSRLLKLGRVRIRITPSPFVKSIRQELRVLDGAIGLFGDGFACRIWVDANHPVLRLQIRSDRPVHVQARLEVWRKERYQLGEKDWTSAYGHESGPSPCVEEADVICPHGKDFVEWYHHNRESIIRENLAIQELADLADRCPDILLNRVFGARMQSDELPAANNEELASAAPVLAADIAVHALTLWPSQPADWRQRLDEQAAGVAMMPVASAWIDHVAWWEAFWKRSWIRLWGTLPSGVAAGREVVDPRNPLAVIERGYALQRFMTACAGRGAYPIKFNGSLFTVETPQSREFGVFATPAGDGCETTPDYRRWGGGYWFQNTRLPYWSCLACGDFDLMRPFFDFYMSHLGLACERSRRYFRHEGACFPETITPWGTYHADNYGWQRTGKGLEPGIPDNLWIARHYTGALEMAMLMLDRWEFTGDEAFLHQTALPWIEACVTFYLEHYPRDGAGRLRIAPSQACETYLDAVNPAPDVAGLRAVLGRLKDLQLDGTARARWAAALECIPEVPVGQHGAETFLSPADSFGQKINTETPELYPVFPFRLFGVGKPELEVARAAFRRRIDRKNGGWVQDGIHAAMLGLSEEAARLTYENFAVNIHEQSRFPAFWGPGYDWVPDQCQGAVAMISIQRMLLQCDGDRILLLPAWPIEWDVDFKLHAAQQTTVHAVWRARRLVMLDVHPPERARAITLCPSNTPLNES